MSDLRALTVHQPHAWAIVAGHKTVENRVWTFPLPHGTTVAIHAGVRHDPGGLHVNLTEQPPATRAVSALVGLVDVVGDHPSCHPRCSRWAVPGSRHWVLRNPRMFREPIPMRGAQRLWKVPLYLQQRISEITVIGNVER